MQKQSNRSGWERTEHPGIYTRHGRYKVKARDARGRSTTRTCGTEAEALRIKAALLTDAARGDFLLAPSVAFADYAEEWIRTYAGRTSRGLRAATMAEYTRVLRAQAVPYFRRMRLHEITTRDVKAYAAHLAARYASRSTVRLYLVPLKLVLATAAEDGVIRADPAVRVRVPHVPQPEDDRPRERALTDDELRRLVAAVPAEWRLHVGVLAATGLRFSEFAALRWRDLDLGNGVVHVRRSFVNGVYGPPKSKYGRRDVPIARALARDLLALRKASRGDDSDLVFPATGGKVVLRQTVYPIVKRAARTAGVPWAGLHTLRHSYATRLFREGVTVVAVSRLLGHHDPAFTMKTYVHLLEGDLADLPEPPFLDLLRPDTDEAELTADAG
jgi:integrase